PLELPATDHIKSPIAKEGGVDNMTDRFNLGVWLGRVASDGSVSGGSVSLLVAEHEKEILSYLCQLSASFGHVQQTVGRGGRGVLPIYFLKLTFARLAHQLV